jgi:pimeloyl-ACP methyl ester carboxylesterase
MPKKSGSPSKTKSPLSSSEPSKPKSPFSSSEPSKPKKSTSTILEKLINFIILLIKVLVGILLTGFFVNWVLLQYESSTLMKTPIGQVLTLKSGRKLNYFCIGPYENNGEVILVPGAGVDYLLYIRYFTKVSKENPTLRFCTYARAGRLFSESHVNASKFEYYISDLEEFIDNVKTKDKITLLGHSMGGIMATHYSFHHPEHIKYLVLVDSVSTGITNDSAIVHSTRKIAQISEVLANVGVIRLLSTLRSKSMHFDVVDDPYHAYFINQRSTPSIYSFWLQDLDFLLDTVYFLRDKLSHAPTFLKGIPVHIEISEQFAPLLQDVSEEWTQMWKNETLLTGISDKVTINIQPGSNHVEGVWGFPLHI